jgi:glycosyltransferase involved in cell wall biosynthesis
MPVHNVEKFVKESVESILNQSFEDFEFIIVNDCSTDNSRKKSDEYTDSRIVRINNTKRIGNYKSRNKGLEIAKGKYICVMDGDDIAFPERLEKQYGFMEENPQYVASGTDAVFFSEIEHHPVQRLCDPQEIKVQLLKENIFTHPSLIIRNEVLKKHNMRYSEDYYYAADYDILVKLSRIGDVTNQSECLLYYRCHSGQITHEKRREQKIYRDRIQLKQLENFKVKPSIDEVIIHHAVMNGIPLSGKQLEAAEKWCNKLMMKNHKVKYYDEDYLFKFLEDRFLILIKNAY